MKKWNFLLVICVILLEACASIPPEAPELSAQLGARIAALEAAHFRLLEIFFSEKRSQVDIFIQTGWIPEFAKEFFEDQKIALTWDEVVKSSDKNDRLTFLTLVGPKLQDKINRKRLELIKPLDELETAIKNKLKAEYNQVLAINNTLTSFLQSASKVEENRKRYLDMIGIKDTDIDTFISATENAVSSLVDVSKNIEKNAELYRNKINDIINQINK